jgi:hypothetical protein
MPHEEIIEAFKLRKRIQWNINLLNAKGRIICYSSIEQGIVCILFTVAKYPLMHRALVWFYLPKGLFG